MSAKIPAERAKSDQRVASKFVDFVNNHPPAQVSQHLRCILLDYIISQLDTGLPLDFDTYLLELYDLFELLDFAAAESK
jgi:hypothetical protein